MKTISAEEFNKTYGQAFPTKPTTGGGLADFATGFAKGGLSSTIETASLLQKGGQAIIAGVDPTRNFRQVQAETGFSSLKGQKLEEIRDLLTAKNSAEKAGKLSELVGEFFIPVGASRKAGELVARGANAVREGVSGVRGGVSGLKEGAVSKLKTLFQTPIPKQVETALGETSGKTFDTYVDVGQRSIGSAKNLTPLEFAGKRAEEALDTIQRKLDNIGATKRSILEQANVGNQRVGNIAVKFRQTVSNSLKSKGALEGDTKLVNDVLNEARNLGNNPTAQEVDNFIDFVQDRIYASTRDFTVPITDSTTGALRKAVGELNSSLKGKLPDSYSRLNGEYSRIIDVRNELNTKLGKEGERAGALMKRVFSPSDANTKVLFEEVKKLSGIDLVDEATVARFVMETLGDARQASMLQQLQLPALSKSGMLQLTRELLAKKFNSTDEILRRARELTTGSQLREATIKSISQPKP